MNFWKSGTIRLRAVESSDAASFHEWNDDSERARNLDYVSPPSSMASIEAWTAEQSLKGLEDGRFMWVIETLDGTPVECIGTHHCEPRTGTFSYGIAVVWEHRCRGYASEAIRLVLRYYFEELRYQKCTVAVHGYNDASLRLHRRLGFELEGVLRRMRFTRGSYFDVHWYGLTSEEYHSRYGAQGR